MPWTITDGSASIGATEFYCVSNSTTPTWQSARAVVQAFFDLSALANGDEFRIRVYERASASGTSRIVDEWVVVGAQSSPILVTPSLVLVHGWEFSLQRLAGTNRTILWSIRRVPEV